MHHCNNNDMRLLHKKADPETSAPLLSTTKLR